MRVWLLSGCPPVLSFPPVNALKRPVLPLLVMLLGASCDTAPVYDPDYRTTYQQVSECQASADHAQMFVVMWANSQASRIYTDKSATVDDGAIAVKDEYFDAACTEFSGVTAMKKMATAPANGRGWYFQRFDANGRLAEEGAPTGCVSCHQRCGASTDLLCGMNVQ